MSGLIPAWIDGRLAPVDKLEAHRRGLRHPAVSVFVMHGPWTLLQRRALAKYHTPGLWTNSCCTHPRWDEDPADCARRRLEEELGLTGLPMRHAGQIEYRADVGAGLTEHEVVDLFVAEAPTLLQVSADPAEVSETRWTRLDELAEQVGETPALFTPWLRIYLEAGLGKAFAVGWGQAIVPPLSPPSLAR